MSEAIAKQAEQARQQNQAFQKEQYESQVRVTALLQAVQVADVDESTEDTIVAARKFADFILNG